MAKKEIIENNKEAIENPSSEFHIENLNETFKEVGKTAEEDSFIESKKSLLDSSNEQQQEAEQKAEEKEQKQNKDGEDSVEQLYGIFGIPKMIEMPIIKDKLDYEWDASDEALFNDGAKAMAEKYGQAGVPIPAEMKYGIGIGLPIAKAWIIKNIHKLMNRKKKTETPIQTEENHPVSQESIMEAMRKMQQANTNNLNAPIAKSVDKTDNIETEEIKGE
jgi:hypothetical protein